MLMLFRFACAATLLLLSFRIESNAQTNLKETHLPVITLRSNPFSFIEIDGNVMIGIGYQWHRRWAATLEPGYIFFSPYNNSENNERTAVSGIKIRTDLRLYFDKPRKGDLNTFIAPEFHYKYVEAKKWDDFGINCLGGQCDYYQKAQYKEVKKEIGASVKLGTILPLWSDQWSIELYGGLGFKFRKFKETDLPIGGSFVTEPDRNNFFNAADEDAAYPLLPAGFKIIFRL